MPCEPLSGPSWTLELDQLAMAEQVPQPAEDVKALKLLSADLQKELQYELCLPYLMRLLAVINGCKWLAGYQRRRALSKSCRQIL